MIGIKEDEMEGKIYKAILGVMRDIGSIGKDQTNKFDGYNFRGIDDIYNSIQPALVKNGVFIVPNLLELNQEDRVSRKGETLLHTAVKVEYRFTADDGSFISVSVPGEAADRSDKSVNKAMSAAYKYACFQTFCIPTKEMIEAPASLDSESDSPEIGKIGTGLNDKIGLAKANVLRKKCQDSGINIDKVCQLYKINDLTDMSLKMWLNAQEHWSELVDMVK